MIHIFSKHYRDIHNIKKSVQNYQSSDTSNINVQRHKYPQVVAHYYFPDGNNNILRLLLKNTDIAITELYQSKTHMRKKLLPKFMWYFFGITLLVLLFIFIPGKVYSDSLKSAVIYGFFANLLVLMIIIFKYAFSSSKEYYNFATKLLRWNQTYIKLKSFYNNKHSNIFNELLHKIITQNIPSKKINIFKDKIKHIFKRFKSLY